MKPKKCGDCNGCCIGPSIEEIGKPPLSMCSNLCPGHKGCKIYEGRPDECKTFNCAWLTSPEMPSRFRPDRCGFLVAGRPDGTLTVWELGGEKFEGSRLYNWLKSELDMRGYSVVRRGKPSR